MDEKLEYEEQDDPYFELGILSCFEVIVSELLSCNDTDRWENIFMGFDILVQRTKLPRTDKALRALLESLASSPEDAKEILPSIQLILRNAISRAEIRIEDEKREAMAARREDDAAQVKTVQRDQFVIIPVVKPEDLLKNTTA